MNAVIQRIPREGGLRALGGVRIIYLVIAIPFVASAFVDVPQVVTLGPVSGLGVLTILIGVFAAMGLLACGRYPTHLLIRLLPYFGFVVWMGISVLWAPPSFWGIQNAILYLLFGALVAVSGVTSARQPAVLDDLVRRCMIWIDCISLGIVSLNLVFRGLPTEPGMWWVGPRSVALLGLIPLSWHLSEWYYGKKWSVVPTILWLAAIAVSLSRTAMAISLLLLGITFFLQLRFRRRKAGWSLGFFLVALTIAIALVGYSKPFRERFFSGDKSIQFGSTTINAEGRLEIWAVVIASARESPLIGKGIGSNQKVLSVAFQGDLEPGHPHNDYLRLWHDLGIIGVLLFVGALFEWLVILVRSWYRAELLKRGAHVELAGVLALLSVLMAMVTDNVIVYVFVMGPVAVLVGAGLGDSAHRNAVPETRHK